jgi:hypothetical protein
MQRMGVLVQYGKVYQHFEAIHDMYRLVDMKALEGTINESI